eukprot:TRINITY_DN6194_c0_g1_i2.p1 TRINITY_DN6194_c0_g1~~TRINITY_DN6194_c0_g1_i2.p1  ORF type:complete len:605 (+),score=101.13 TRINITY_DN6194_c0_g1_i2:213-2027(+)
MSFDIVSRVLFPTPEASYGADDFPEELIWIPRNLDPETSGPEDCIPCLLILSPSARFTVLYLHSNAEDLGRCYGFCSLVRHQFQVHVVAVEYPGYGICPGGQASEESVTDNAFVAFRFIRETLEWPLDGIILLGRSIGCGPALSVAVQHNVYGVAIVCPFLSVQELCKDHIGVFARLINDRFANKDHVPLLESPLLIVHGKKDVVVPVSHGERLYQLCRSRKRFVSPAEMEHNTNIHSDPNYFVLPMLQFFSLPDYCFDEIKVPRWVYDKRFAIKRISKLAAGPSSKEDARSDDGPSKPEAAPEATPEAPTVPAPSHGKAKNLNVTGGIRSRAPPPQPLRGRRGDSGDWRNNTNISLQHGRPRSHSLSIFRNGVPVPEVANRGSSFGAPVGKKSSSFPPCDAIKEPVESDDPSYLDRVKEACRAPGRVGPLLSPQWLPSTPRPSHGEIEVQVPVANLVPMQKEKTPEDVSVAPKGTELPERQANQREVSHLDAEVEPISGLLVSPEAHDHAPELVPERVVNTVQEETGAEGELFLEESMSEDLSTEDDIPTAPEDVGYRKVPRSQDGVASLMVLGDSQKGSMTEVEEVSATRPANPSVSFLQSC